VLTAVRGAVDVHVLVVHPAGVAPDFESSGTCRRVAELPGVTMHSDADGLLMRRLGLTTSGHVLVYADGGHLLYSGGITGSRGHEGDNDGESAVIAAIQSGRPADRSIPTYGCGLWAGD
jgi:hypothetical protein